MSNTCKEPLKKQGQTPKQHSPMDTHGNSCVDQPAKNLHSSTLYRHWMPSIGLTKSNGW